MSTITIRFSSHVPHDRLDNLSMLVDQYLGPIVPDLAYETTHDGSDAEQSSSEEV